MSYRSRRRDLNIWPGFVDALSALLMVVVFVIMVFTVGQFLLTDLLTGRDKAIDRLNGQIAELSRLLDLEQAESGDLRQNVARLDASLQMAEAQSSQLSRDLASLSADFSQLSAADKQKAEQLAGQLAQLADLSTNIRLLRELKSKLESQVAGLLDARKLDRKNLAQKTALSDKALAQVEMLNRQVADLRTQLAQIARALDVAKSTIGDKESEISDLGKRLSLALASKIQRLAGYRSEFFGRLKAALGDHPDLTIVGDRFIFQSELLFASASDVLGAQGQQQVGKLVKTLKDISQRIPDDLDWVLRVDGHTDNRAISTRQFASNWELSTARALAIVKYMVALGVDPKRLAATGFGEHHPLEAGSNEQAWARNRRIEIKLTSR